MNNRVDVTIKKERFVWLDNARIFAMIVMILGHAVGAFINGDVATIPYYGAFIVAFNMPMFVILSGYGHYNGLMRLSSVKDCMISLWKSFCNIILPVFIILLVYSAIDGSW